VGTDKAALADADRQGAAASSVSEDEGMSTIDDGHDMARLRERRRQARRRRRLVRLDTWLAVTGAIVVLLATPGLAIAAIVAFVLLGVCAASIAWERSVAWRSARAARPRRQIPARRTGESRRR
jgi:hypothetical protein